MKFLDLDAIHEDLKDVTIKLGGVVHALTPLSFGDYIANQKTIQSLSGSEDILADVEKRFEATVEMIARSFKSAPVEELRKLTTTQLNRLLDFTRRANGDVRDEPQSAPKVVEGEVIPPGEAPSIGSENPTSA